MRVGIYVISLSVIIGPAIAQQTSDSKDQQSGTTQTGTQSQTGTKTQSGMQGQKSTASGVTSEMKTQTYKGVLVDAACAMGQSGAGSAGMPSDSTMSSSTGSSMTSDTSANRSTSTETPSGNTATMDQSTGSTSETPREAGASSTSAGASGTMGASGSAASSEKKSRKSTSSADRSAGAACSVSSGTSQFALKMDDGRTLRFDMVGNQRAQDEMKTGKKWSKATESGKPVKVTVNGAVSGDKLIVSSIR